MDLLPVTDLYAIARMVAFLTTTFTVLSTFCVLHWTRETNDTPTKETHR